MNPDVAIIRTGTANLASVMAGLRRLAINPRVVDSPSQLGSADAVVLPGVGAFASGMAALREAGWDHVLMSRWETNEPTLAICLGLQLLCRHSEESPGVDGLGILPASVVALPDSVSVPHLGWNQLESRSEFFSARAILLCEFVLCSRSGNRRSCRLGHRNDPAWTSILSGGAPREMDGLPVSPRVVVRSWTSTVGSLERLVVRYRHERKMTESERCLRDE